jgi:hypothetical protein
MGAEEEKVQFTSNSFYDVIHQLNLPHKLPPSKQAGFKKGPVTSFDVKNKFHMVEVLDLSGFRGKVVKCP